MSRHDARTPLSGCDLSLDAVGEWWRYTSGCPNYFASMITQFLRSFFFITDLIGVEADLGPPWQISSWVFHPLRQQQPLVKYYSNGTHLYCRGIHWDPNSEAM